VHACETVQNGKIRAVPPSIPETVVASLEILEAQQSMTGSGGQPTSKVEERIARVVAVLGEVGARWVLVGAHAVALHTEPRATVDFDFVVEGSKLERILAALQQVFGELRPFDMGPAVRLEALAIDLIRSTTHPLFAEALSSARPSGAWRVPAPETLIALKFLSAVNPWRGPTKRTYDVGDLRALVQSIGFDNLDVPEMKRLAALAYPGAEREFTDLLGRIERGEPIRI
jgi:hypothetical protein